MHSLRFLLSIVLIVAAATAASALVIDDFEGGDLSAWNIEAPYYASLSVTSPGAGGSGKALAIQEITGSAGAHSANALAHRRFTTPADWTSYSTLEFDAAISAGDWNGYSILVYNNNQGLFLRGIHSDSAISGFRKISFDISGIARNQITEIVVYVNKTRQDSSQVLYLDNIQTTNTPVVGPPSEIMIADLDNVGTDINRWTDYNANTSPNGKSATYQTTTTIVTDGSTKVASIALAGTSTSAYGQYAFPKTIDGYAYSTLQFDAKLATGTNPDGFSARLYNGGDVMRSLRAYQGAGQKLRKLSPSTAGYVTCYIDISGATRDQLSSIMVYVNRTGANSAQAVRLDNIKLTNEPIPSTPNEIWLDTFDPVDGFPTDIARWDYVHASTSRALTPEYTDFVSAPYALDILQIGTSTSAYARRSWIVAGQSTYDLCDYRSLIFDAKLVQNGATSPSVLPFGFSANIVNAVAGVDSAGMSNGDYQLPFVPSSWDESGWTTYALDITGFDLDQLKWLRFYTNRCGATGVNQILRLDNIRVSKEPAPEIDYSNLDDFEDGNIDDWYYNSSHNYPEDTDPAIPGVSHELTTDAASGNYAIKITNLTPPGSSSAYCRKTMHAKLLKYSTLEFDAKVANSNTSQGFSVVLRGPGGNANTHTFCPTNEWKTFRFDIRGDRVGNLDVRQEVSGILFYVNGLGGFGASQDGSQELYIDNLRLSSTAVQTGFASIGDVDALDDGSTVTLDGKICTGFFDLAMIDRNNWSIQRHLMFVEEADRSAAVPVVLGYDMAPVVPAGSKVRVTGTLVTDLGIRYIYATSVTVQDSGLTIPDPVGITNKACGNGYRGLDAGVAGFAGRNTNGMLVTIWGNVTAMGSDESFRSFWYVDDGSGVEGDNGAIGVRVYDFSGGAMADVGQYVRATGFVLNHPERDIAGNPTGKVVRGLWLVPGLPDALTPINQ